MTEPHRGQGRGRSRREVLGDGLALGAAALLPSTVFGAPRLLRHRRPNILLIVSDQERNWVDLPPDLGLHAHERLLARGVGFERFNANTSPCSPSRSNLYTGQHTQKTLMTSNLGAPPYPEFNRDLPTLGHLFREHGYYTAYKGKWHLSEIEGNFSLQYGAYPNTRDALEPFGFSDFNFSGDPHGVTWSGYKYDGQIASTTVQWLHEQGRDLRGRQPWLMAVNFVNPHDIMFYDSGGDQRASRLRANLLGPLKKAPVGGVYDRYWDRPLPPSFYREDLSAKPWSQRSYADFCDFVYGRMDPADEGAWRRFQSYYFNCIRDVDRHVTTVLDALEEAGLDDNTIVVYTADHGEMAGGHGLRQKGPHMYRENNGVPLIVRHPDVSGGVSTDALGSTVDVLPTLLSLAGVDPGATHPALAGVDLSPALDRPGARSRRDQRGILYNYGTMLYTDPEYSRYMVASGHTLDLAGILSAGFNHGSFLPSRDNPGLFRGVHTDRYKFARYFVPADHHIPEDWDTLLAHNELELYDIEQDPHELHNLAARPEAHRELILRLNARTNALIAAEVGVDDGAEHRGPTFLYKL